MPPRRKPKKLEKRSNQAKANVAKRVKKAQIDRRAAENQDKARSGQLKNKKGNIATGGESTGRESGIMASQKANKIKGLEQSVGSLDRRIQNALDKGDTGTAKDLRSRLNKFTTKLGYERAIMHGGVRLNKDGKIERSTSGKPILSPLGKKWFDETKDQDFIDPTRKLKNTDIAAFREMYPNPLIKGARGLADLYEKFSPMANIAKAWNKAKGLPVVNELGTMGRDLKNVGKETKNALMKNINLPKIEFRKRNVPYNLDDMPGVRYPLDEGWGRGEGATPFGGRSRDPNYKQPFFSWPDTDVSISDMVIPEAQDDQEGAFEYDPVPYIHPSIDPNKRSEIMEEGYGDIIESGRQDYDTLFREWEKNNLNQADSLDKFGDPIDPVKLQELKDALDAEQNAFAEERQNKFYNKDGIEVGGDGNLLNVGKELYNLGGYLSGGQALNKYVLEPGANAILGENPMVPIDQSEFNPENIDYSQITETLKGPKYNLQDDQIQELLNYKPDLLNSSDINSTLADFYSQ